MSISIVNCLLLTTRSAQNGLAVPPIVKRYSSSISPGSFCSVIYSCHPILSLPSVDIDALFQMAFYLPGYLSEISSLTLLQTGAMWPNLPQLWHSAPQNLQSLAS